MTRWLRLRWGLDRVIAGGLTVLSAPLSLAVAVMIRVLDGPPAVVRLPRIGQDGEPFEMAKFRSMRVDHESGLSGGPPITAGGADSRVTPWGHRLRHYRLDELPQLVEVVRGRMALFGPRPETPEYVDLDDARWRRVLRARPGIAGATQVVIHDYEAGLGINDLERYEAEMLPVKLAVDEWYLTHASLLIDGLVALALVERFVLRRRTTALHRRLTREVPEVASMLDRERAVAAIDR